MAGTSAGDVWLWWVADRTPLLAVQGHTSPVYAVALSGDGLPLASGSEDGATASPRSAGSPRYGAGQPHCAEAESNDRQFTADEKRPAVLRGRLVVMALIDGLLTSVSRELETAAKRPRCLPNFECQVRPSDASQPCRNKVRLPSRDQRFCPGHVAAEWAHFHQGAAALAATLAAGSSRSRTRVPQLFEPHTHPSHSDRRLAAL